MAEIKLVDLLPSGRKTAVAENPGSRWSTFLNQTAWGLSRALRHLARLSGQHRLAEHPVLNWYDLRGELADLRAYKIAAASELEALKERSLSDADSLRVQGDYLRTLEVLQGVRSGAQDAVVEGPAVTLDKVSPIRAADTDAAAATYSCRWIEGGMSFVPGQVRVCPNCNAKGGAPGLARFPDAALPVEDILRKKEIIRQGNQQDAFDPCTRCAYREKKGWPKKEHAFNILCLSHATACNLACDYCHTIPEERYLQNPGQVPPLLPVIRQLIDEGHLAPDTLVQWGGGEPTILREFNEMFTLLENHGAFSEVYTSGVRISQVVMDALARDTAGVMVSLDAGTADTYRHIKGRDSFNRVVDNVQQYAQRNIDSTILKMIFFERNLGEVTAFLDVAERAGVRIVCFDTPLYRDHVDDRFIDAAALFCDEAERRGLEWRPGEVGLVYNPADRVYGRVQDNRSASLA